MLKKINILSKPPTVETKATCFNLLKFNSNPIMKMGYENFASMAGGAGVDGVITVDMPPEESQQLNSALKIVSIDAIFLIAPTTALERIKKIADLATGYLYYVSLKGVTGAGHLDIDSVNEKLQQIKSITTLPVTVGFGIKDTMTAAMIANIAEGVVVGSALVKEIAELATQGQSRAINGAAKLIGEMRQAMDNA